MVYTWYVLGSRLAVHIKFQTLAVHSEAPRGCQEAPRGCAFASRASVPLPSWTGCGFCWLFQMGPIQICMYVHMCTCTYTCVYTYIHMHVYTSYIHTCLYILNTYEFAGIRFHICIHVHIYMYVSHVHIRLHIYVCIYIYIHAYVYAHAQTHARSNADGAAVQVCAPCPVLELQESKQLRAG